MMKKASGFIITALIFIAVLVLVYTFIKKGYSNGGGAVSVVSQETPSPEPVQTVVPTISNKISLTISSPADGTTLSSTNVTVKGKTTPNADVFVNDQTGKADASGNFSISIGLDEGANQIVVSANDSIGNATEQDLNVTVSSFQ
jgi:hypothetical protein